MKVPDLTFVYDRKGRSAKDKPASVEMIISLGSKRKYITTGVKLLPKEWKDGSVRGCHPRWKELNDQLQLMKKRCSEIITHMMEEGNLDLDAIPSLLTESMMQRQTFLEYAKSIAQKRFKKISDGTKEHYELFFRFMEKWRGIIYFTDVTERNVLLLDEYLADKGLKEVSRWSYHKILKTFILQALDDGLVKRNPYTRLDIKRGGEDGLKRFLTPEEFRRFEKCSIPTDRLRRVRDLFVFQTYTCLSYSDLAAFRYEDCITVGGQAVYKSNRHKTGQEFIVVLLPPALKILEIYNYKLPVISNVKYNDYLKAAVLHAGIEKPVSSHWARHTGATLLINEGGLPMHVVQHILGHASIRETEKTYAKVLDDTIVKAMADISL